MTFRVGSGLDIHAFSQDTSRPLVLGGITIPGAPGLEGHSDADVVAHAVTDALLGALALGDLGSRFGTADPELAGASSMELLAEVRTETEAAGWEVANLDLTIVAERPRLAAHRPEIAERLAATLAVGVDRVSVKVTSTDGLGAVGRGDGIACWATLLVSAS